MVDDLLRKIVQNLRFPKLKHEKAGWVFNWECLLCMEKRREIFCSKCLINKIDIFPFFFSQNSNVQEIWINYKFNKNTTVSSIFFNEISFLWCLRINLFKKASKSHIFRIFSNQNQQFLSTEWDFGTELQRGQDTSFPRRKGWYHIKLLKGRFHSVRL